MSVKVQKDKIMKIYWMANSFKNGFDDAIKNIQIKRISTNPGNGDDVPYCIALGSLACELYLKFIYSYNYATDPNNRNSNVVSFSKVHDLNMLFNKLTTQQKTDIITYMADTAFETNLKSHSDDFKTWRYIFEHNIKNSDYQSTFLEKFVSVLYSYATTIIIDNHSNDLFKNFDMQNISMSGTFESEHETEE